MEDVMDVQENETRWFVNLNYNDCKTIIREKLRNMATNFMAAGYYIRYVRDNKLYQEDGYKNIHEFAAALYGMSQQQTNHCMRINERFSKDGYSPIPGDSFRDFSKSQLQEMLYLTDDQLADVTPDMTVKQIREIKNPLDVERTETQNDFNAPEYPEDQDVQEDDGYADVDDKAELSDPKREENVQEKPVSVIEDEEYATEDDHCEYACADGITDKNSRDITPKTVLQEESDKLNQWVEAFDGEKDVPEFIEKQKIIVAALASMVCDLEAMERITPDQPDLPVLKNNDQRKMFLDNYQTWPIWFDVPQASEVYHRYDLPDKSSIVVCEYYQYLDWKERYSDEDPVTVRTREYILKPGYHYLHDCLSNRTAVVEHLKEALKNAK